MSFVKMSVDDGVADIVLDRPKVNALNRTLLEELGAAFAQVSQDSQIRGALLRSEGLDTRQYLARFGTGFSPELAELVPLFEEGLAVREGAVLRLSAAGMERSDAIGPWLYSQRVRALSEAFALC